LAREVRLVLSANCKSLLETCGCPSDKAGGLPEKAAMLAQWRREGIPMVTLDAGDAVEATDQLARADTAIRAMAAAGYQALNIGDQEAARGADFIAHLASLTPIKIVSTNLVFASTGKHVANPFVIIPTGAARIAVLGVVDAVADQSGGAAAKAMRALDAQAEVTRCLSKLPRPVDAVVLLAHVSPERGKALARIPGITVVVGGDQRSDIPGPERIGDALWIQPPSFGRDVAVVRLVRRQQTAAAGGGARNLYPEQWRIARVPWRGTRDLQVARIIAGFEAVEKKPLEDLLSRTTTQHEGYAGVQKCAECHAPIVVSWQKTGHAAAWETLKQAGHRYDPDCLSCHTTGDPNKPPSVALKGVQCEDCHLPWAQHSQYDTGARHEKDVDWQPVCTRCHNKERSPDFVLAPRLERVKH
jgi:2',3'-cyclic-nucleotide 2'-phosphodiesterase (5'-nucleotidase family)